MNKKSICIDCRILRTGIGTYIRNLLNLLAENEDFDIYVLVYKQDEHYVPSNVVRIFFQAQIYSIAEQIEFIRKIPVVDIFWSPHYNVPLLPIKARHRVVTIHDVFHLAHFKELNLKQKIYARIVLFGALFLSKKVITVSEFSKLEILKYLNYRKDKIAVIHNGVKQESQTKKFDDVAKKYQLPPKYILYIGSVKPHKNLRRLLQAYSKLSSKIREEFKIVIAGKRDGFITGDSQLTSYINENISVKEKVIFTGFIDDDDMDTIYSGAELFAFPSLYEGFGLPPLEAMINECPVIVSSIPSLKEICGSAVLYVDPYNVDDIKDKLENLIQQQSLKDMLISQGKIHASKYTWAHAYEKHRFIFQSFF